MERESIRTPPELLSIQQQAETESHSLVYVAVGDALAGVLEMQPTLRPEISTVIETLKQRNIELYIISGDHEAPTRKMAQMLGIDNYFAEVLPENKADYVKQLKEQGRFVCFIGDGINDAIALKSAHISISLKGASTAATDTAQIIFMDGTLNHLPSLFQFVDEFEQTMDRNYLISTVPGVIIIGGVYVLHFGIALSMGIFYLSCFAALGNVLLPLVKYQEEQALTQLESADSEQTGEAKEITHVTDHSAV
jgi:Cu2+-exporting ATPase